MQALAGFPKAKEVERRRHVGDTGTKRGLVTTCLPGSERKGLSGKRKQQSWLPDGEEMGQFRAEGLKSSFSPAFSNIRRRWDRAEVVTDTKLN